MVFSNTRAAITKAAADLKPPDWLTYQRQGTCRFDPDQGPFWMGKGNGQKSKRGLAAARVDKILQRKRLKQYRSLPACVDE